MSCRPWRSAPPSASVSLGTPHCSPDELRRLAALVDGVRLTVPLYVNTGRDVLADAEASGVAGTLRGAGVTFVTDTCTYITPIIERTAGPVVTNSGKWAWYAPGNLGFDVAFATLEECVRFRRDRTASCATGEHGARAMADPTASRVLAAGVGRGRVLVLDEPLSFWGGLDPVSGRLIDAHHPQAGERLVGRVIVLPSGRGSSSSSSVLAESIRMPARRPPPSCWASQIRSWRSAPSSRRSSTASRCRSSCRPLGDLVNGETVTVHANPGEPPRIAAG